MIINQVCHVILEKKPDIASVATASDPIGLTEENCGNYYTTFASSSSSTTTTTTTATTATTTTTTTDATTFFLFLHICAFGC